MPLKCCTQYASKYGKLSSGHRTGKVSFHSSQECCFKLSHNCTHPSHMLVMLKILQARLQQYMNHEVPYVQAGFRKGRGTRDQIANIPGSWIKQESSRKTSISALLTMPQPLTVWITTNYGKFLRDGNIRPPYLTPEKPVCRSRSNI